MKEALVMHLGHGRRGSDSKRYLQDLFGWYL